jgi:aspartyl-tRNA(Asn)/glutamyl-tRNA(Gln) amidotransferase subunit A
VQHPVTPLAGVEAALARIAEVNPTVNALCLVDAEAARERARELEARMERGEVPGPLSGWTFTVKDAMRQAGYPATAGSRALMDAVPDASTACVHRLEAAGAVAIGRSNVPEFCYRGTTRNELYGQTGNPFAPDRSAGGSSGGAASAVALGVGELGLGSDGGGSVRIPGSFCGTVGLKPTYGLVPRHPDTAGWLLLTHFGPLTRTVADCGLALAAMAGPDPHDPLCLPALGLDYAAAAREPGDLTGLRVAASDDLGYIRLDGEVRERFAEAVEAFAKATGATVESTHPGLGSPLDVWNTIACGDNTAR